MSWYSTITRKLYLRIWLAVASSVIVCGLIVLAIWYFRWGWLRPPYVFWLAVMLTGLTAMMFIFPFVRRLTHRLETLRQGVQHWEQSNLSMLLSDFGDDEVADLARHFNAAAHRVTALIESQKSLLTHASHELRSPLARIRMAVELAFQSQSNTTRQRARTEILHNLNELDKIIEEVLLANRITIRPNLYDTEPVDLLGLLAEECSHARVPLNISPDIMANPARVAVQGSLSLLRQAVRNLLENAARHGKQDDGTGKASVLLECPNAEEDEVLIHVDDRGPGIPTNQRKHIFEPFYTLPGTPNRGLGLGLALVRMIAQYHSGSITCSDREGGGARFTLRLPHETEIQSA